MKKIRTNEVGQKNQKTSQNALAHLGSAPVQICTGAPAKCAQAEQQACTAFWFSLICVVTHC